jgi:HEAT repeat protein
MKRLALVLLLFSLPLQAADTSRLMRQVERGSTAERTAALRDLAKEDAPAATAKAIEWLEPNVDPALRRAAVRTLWDLGDKAKSAEPALRARLDDRDDDVAYGAVGALSTMGVPKAELRTARLRLARSNDGFIAFYASRALFPDPELPLDAVIDAALAGVNLVAGGRPSDMKTRDTLRTNTRVLLESLAKQSERAGFDALMRAYAKASPPGREAIASALDHVPPQHGDALQIGALLDSPQPWVRRGAMFALVDYQDQAAPVVDKVIVGLWPPQEPDWRKAAAAALGGIGRSPGEASAEAKPSAWRSDVEARIAPALARAATSDPDRDVRKEAADALQKLGLWAGPALGAIGERIAQEPDPVVRHALVRACWNARESPQLPRAVLASLAANDPVDYVRNVAGSVLKAVDR